MTLTYDHYVQGRLDGLWVGLRTTDTEGHSVGDPRASATLKRLQGSDIGEGGREKGRGVQVKSIPEPL